MIECRNQLQALDSIAVTMRCRRRGQEIYGQGDPAESAYRILSGAARRVAIPANGRRRIVDFLLPGDFLGFAGRDTHTFDVEAVNATTVLARYGRRTLERLSASDPRVRWAIRAATAQEICRLQARVLLLGRISAFAKVGGFLLEMANRSSKASTDWISLPMSRYDIADYLALSVETVSRAMTLLERRGVIALASSRQVRILDPSILDAADDGDGGTRRSWVATSVFPGDAQLELSARAGLPRSTG